MGKYNDYTYDDYLRTWESLFGDDEIGNYGYFVHNVEVSHQVERLTEEQFEMHVSALAEADVAFDLACESGNDVKMGEALEKAFPHELALLI